MKQNITEEQWLELSHDQMVNFLTSLGFKEVKTGTVKTPTNPDIKEMIKFLGEDLKNYTFKGEVLVSDDFCDTLWEMCKYKLNNNQ